MDKTRLLWMLADEHGKKRIDNRGYEPLPVTIPESDLPGSGSTTSLRRWQFEAIQQMMQHRTGHIIMPYSAGKKTLIARICGYVPRVVKDWPDFRVLVIARDKLVAKKIWMAHNTVLGRSFLLGQGSDSEDERARIIISTAASAIKVGHQQFDLLMAYEPYDLMTPEMLTVLRSLKIFRAYGFSNSDRTVAKDRAERIGEYFGSVVYRPSDGSDSTLQSQQPFQTSFTEEADEMECSKSASGGGSDMRSS